MALHCCTGANMTCTMGLAPAVFNATTRPLTTSNVSAGNISDHVPMLNIAAFGMCRSPANPMVAAATSANAGVLTPQSCIPVTAAPWTPGAPTVLLANMPALNNSSTLTCAWGGTISFVDAGQVALTIP